MKSQTLTLFATPVIASHDARVHAMKNCLSTIRAIVHLCQPDLPPRSRDRFTRLTTASLRLEELIESALPVRDGVEPEEPPAAGGWKPTCVASLVESVAARLLDRAEMKRVELFVQCQGGQLVGDPPALGEVLFNLIANAIDATPGGGGVFVATYVTTDGDQYWCVQDTGPGIPAEQFPALGNLFCSGRVGGSGLGLALAQQTVARHAGLIRVESAQGAGTTVSVWLPREGT